MSAAKKLKLTRRIVNAGNFHELRSDDMQNIARMVMFETDTDDVRQVETDICREMCRYSNRSDVRLIHFDDSDDSEDLFGRVCAGNIDEPALEGGGVEIAEKWRDEAALEALCQRTDLPKTFRNLIRRIRDGQRIDDDGKGMTLSRWMPEIQRMRAAGVL